MGFFKRKQASNAAGSGSELDGQASTGAPAASESSNGLVSSVLNTPSEDGEPTPFGDIVERRFGPAAARSSTDRVAQEAFQEPREQPVADTRAAGAFDLDAALEEDPLLASATARDIMPVPNPPTLEIDPMAHIGCSTTITGKIVADEDLEVHGTVEGSIALDHHQLTVGAEGLVQADVEANSVLVIGRVTGNVTATDVVEVKAGGHIGGDVAAPRIIMADGAIVIGTLDMTSALPKNLERHEPTRLPPSRNDAADLEPIADSLD